MVNKNMIFFIFLKKFQNREFLLSCKTVMATSSHFMLTEFDSEPKIIGEIEFESHLKHQENMQKDKRKMSK